MRIISRTQLARQKIMDIEAGRSAYAETKELSAIIRKKLQSLGIEVIEDTTTMGSWFVPKK